MLQSIQVLRNAPGPSSYALLKSLPGLQRSTAGFLMALQHQYGDVVRLQLAGRTVLYFFNHPEHVQQVLLDNGRNYRKSQFFKLFTRQLGQGLITSEGELWRSQRRMMQPYFKSDQLSKWINPIARTVSATLERWHVAWDRGEAIDITAEMLALSQGVVLNALFGDELDVDVSAVRDAITTDRKLSVILGFVPTPSNLLRRKASQALSRAIYRLIADRRKTARQPGDLLSKLLLAHDPKTGREMDDGQLHDELITLLFAGSETTAHTLAWAWYLLARHPDMERRLHTELDERLAGRTPTAEDVLALGYTEQVVLETMRLYPAVFVSGRIAVRDHQVGRYPVAAGTPVLICPYVTHRHPDFWQNLEAFDPERFSPEQAGQRTPYSYIPFSAGSRSCIGQHFAVTEAKMALAMIAQVYRLQQVSSGQAEPREVGTVLQAPRGLLMLLQKRGGGPTT